MYDRLKKMYDHSQLCFLRSPPISLRSSKISKKPLEIYLRIRFARESIHDRIKASRALFKKVPSSFQKGPELFPKRSRAFPKKVPSFFFASFEPSGRLSAGFFFFTVPGSKNNKLYLIPCAFFQDNLLHSKNFY